jgi:hypothetical protein
VWWFWRRNLRRAGSALTALPARCADLLSPYQ